MEDERKAMLAVLQSGRQVIMKKQHQNSEENRNDNPAGINDFYIRLDPCQGQKGYTLYRTIVRLCEKWQKTYFGIWTTLNCLVKH